MNRLFGYTDLSYTSITEPISNFLIKQYEVFSIYTNDILSCVSVIRRHGSTVDDKSISECFAIFCGV